MAQLTPQVPAVTGSQITFAAASAGGDTVNYQPKRTLFVKNDSAGPVTVTISVHATVAGVTVPNLSFNVPLGEIHAAVLQRKQGDSDGVVSITYSAAASVTVAAIDL